MDKKTATTLADVDLMAVQLADERRARVDGEVSLLLEKAGLNAKIGEVQAAYQNALQKIMTEYSLGQGDNLDLSTGEINRAPRPTAESVPSEVAQA